jgi:hypothetical protein
MLEDSQQRVSLTRLGRLPNEGCLSSVKLL